MEAARARDVPAVALLDLGAHEAQPLEVLLDPAHTDVVPTRLGDARLAGARDQRPEEEEGAAHPPAQIGVDLGGAQRGGVQAPGVRVGLLDGDANVLEHPRHRRDVLDVRDVAQLHLLVGQQRRRHDRQGGVLAPRDRDAPLEPAPATDAQEFHLRLPYSTARPGSRLTG